MAEDIVIDVNNPYAAEILRDLDAAKRSERAGHRVLLLKYMLENLACLEKGNCGLSQRAVRYLRATVLKELTAA